MAAKLLGSARRAGQWAKDDGAGARFTADGLHVVIGLSGGGVELWDVARNRLAASAGGASIATTALAFSPDGGQLVLGGYGSVTLRGTGTARHLGGLTGWVAALAFQPDGKALAVVSGTQSGVLDLASGALAPPVSHAAFAGSSAARQVRTGTEQLDAAYDPNAARMALTAKDTTMQVWDVRAGTKLFELSAPDIKPDAKVFIRKAAYSGDGKFIAGAVEQHFVLWDAQDGRRLKTLQVWPGGVCAWTVDVALNRDGSLAALQECGDTAVIDARAGRVLRRLSGAKGPYRFLADGSTLVTRDSARPGRLKLWDGRSGQLVRELVSPSGDTEVVTYAVSPNGKTVASAERDNTVRLWDRDSGRLLLSLTQLWPSGWVALTPEGHFDASSAEAERILAVRHGEGLFDVAPMANYREKLYRPGMLRVLFSR